MGFGGAPDLEPVDSLSELIDLLQFGAHDPRVQAILMDINPMQCGYAKLQELRKAMKYFRSSGTVQLQPYQCFQYMHRLFIR